MAPPCCWCQMGVPVIIGRGRAFHFRDIPKPCENFDSEARYYKETPGRVFFSWKMRRCRNGLHRMLCWLEEMKDGTFTLANRRVEPKGHPNG